MFFSSFFGFTISLLLKFNWVPRFITFWTIIDVRKVGNFISESTTFEIKTKSLLETRGPKPSQTESMVISLRLYVNFLGLYFLTGLGPSKGKNSRKIL